MPSFSRYRSISSVTWKGAAIALAAIAVYLPALGGGFVWDDLQYVQANPLLKDPQGLFRIWFQPPASPQYYPLTFTTFWLEYQAWGLAPRGYHVVNVLLHTANTFLLFRLLIGLKTRGAFLVALLFAVHPLRVESVAWVTERKDVLSGFFFFATLLVWRRFRVLGDGRSYLVAIILFLCGLFSKTAICPLPAVLLLWEWRERGKVPFRFFLKTVPFFGLALFFGVLHVVLESKNIGTAQSSVDLSHLERFLIAGRAFWFYVGKTLWPYPLMAIHPRWEIDVSNPLAYVFPLFAFLAFVLLWSIRGRTGRDPLAALGFYLVTIAPVLGFASQAFYRYSFVAEHFQYLAGAGLLLLFVGMGAHILDRFRISESWRGLLVAPIALGCGVLTWQSSALYKDSEMLFAHNLRYNPDSWGVHTALGAALLGEPGKMGKALEHLETAARLEPDQAQAHYNLGVARASAGKFEKAIESYREAVRLEPNFPPALNNLGIALEEAGRYEEAIEQYDRALKLDPDFVQAADNRVKARLRLNLKRGAKKSTR